MKTRIYKFGGSSVRDAEHIINVGNILKNADDIPTVVVVSAMGKTTNALEKVCKAFFNENRKTALDKIESIMWEHMDVARELDLKTKSLLTQYRKQVDHSFALIKEKKLTYDFVYDQIVSLGELFSTKLIDTYLNHIGLSSKWMDVRQVFVSDSTYREAKLDLVQTSKKVQSKTKSLFRKSNFIITQGFLARDKEGYTTTLGREGSDYTAAIMAYSTDVSELSIWKDVQGILTADPKRFENVEKIDKLSYNEAIEMTYYGAKVIHPKTIKPLQNKGIKLYVKSFLNPDSDGTLISEHGMLSYPPIVVIDDDVILLQITTKDFTFIAGDHLSEIFSKLSDNRLKIGVMRNSAISFTICITNAEDIRLKSFLKSLGENFEIEIFKNLKLITIRHYQKSIIESLTQNKIILFRETSKKTVQLVVKPALELKEKRTSK